ncbi:putative cytochrome P450 2J6 [Apostichopus japonicus]|uniref:Putative cytochrome P450 2J6 n=2 Tax=Stichopus japonicus TaxID=307972 RepID=A0A2G8KZ57_STIJA|nr:putative cytochrome P450 2J6 [Apostichopus japonicus]
MFLLVAVIFFISLIWFNRDKRYLPPGPIGLPIIGNLPYFILCKKEAPEAFGNLAKRNGPIIYVRFGAMEAIVLNDFKTIQEAMNHPDLQDRPEQKTFESKKIKDAVGGKAEGIAMASGKAWKHQRKFLVNTFRDFGVGKSRFEDSVAMEAAAMMAAIREKNNLPFDPQILFSNAFSNIICSVTFGKRFEYYDPKFERLLALVLRQFEVIGGAAVLAAFPILGKFEFGPIKEVTKNTLEFINFFQNIINDHKSKFDENNINDVIDAYMLEMRSSEVNGSPDPEVFNEKNLGALVGDLFFAGIDSSVSSLRWALVYFLINPEVQVKVQTELDDVIGRDRMPRWEDRSRLPYVEATIAEIQRIGTVAAIGGTHAARKDVTFRGYTIPKGIAVIPNVYAVMRNPVLWPKPLEFKPERFLDENGKFTKPEHFIPFNIGPRKCPGEQLAKMELFIFLTHLLHKFTFYQPEDTPAPSTDGKMGLTFKPPPFQVSLRERD